MFDFYIMEFGIYQLVDLLGDTRPWELVSGAGMEH
jgi:hypothetical protein